MIRVVIVDDSAICRAALRETLEAERDIRVVGEATSGTDVLKVITREKPHLVTMDLQMPGASGFEAIEEIMAKHPVPILVVTAQSRASSAAAFEAVRRGALQLAEKPPPGTSAAAGDLRAQVRLLSKIPVVRHVAGLRDKALVRAARVPTLPSALPPVAAPLLVQPKMLVGVAASAGGPGAVATLLGHLPPTFEGCIAVVQHLPKGFASSFVDFLRSRTHLRVKLVEDTATQAPATVFIAPDDRHLVVTSRHQLRAADHPPVAGFRPSATVLFRSMAEVLGGGSIGVILSGMGSDGAEGLELMRKHGAITIAQDEATSAVYGMPRAAAERGAASLILPLAKIGDAVVEGLQASRANGRIA